MSTVKFSVGYQLFKNDEFIDEIVKFKESISEVYFSWGDFPNGRNLQTERLDMYSWQAQQKQMQDLKKLSEEKIGLNLLFNGNCYGKDSQSRAFFEKIGDTVDFIKDSYGLNSVTTTSPLIAKFLKNNFENLHIRASVNMEIGSIEGMKYISEYFDSFYMKRELNRNFDAIEKLHSWCEENGKELYLLANSGCLNNCSVHNFHDNLVAHENEISKMDNAYDFRGICKEFLKKEENYIALIENTNFVRPEDIYMYEPYFKAAKLATRVNPRPIRILESYIRGSYSGNILELLEPVHNIYPYIVENGNPLKLRKLDTDIAFLE